MTDLSNFKPIENYEDYLVNENGDIFSIRRRKYLKSHKNERGYLNITLCKNNKHKHFKVHRLVALTFIQNPDNLPQINHKNGIKTDNRVENLEWVSASQNIKHAWDNGLKENNRKAIRQNCKKVGKLNAKHLDENLKELFDEIFIFKLKTKDIANKYNISKSHISNIKAQRLLKTAISEYFADNPDIVYQPKFNNKVKKLSLKEKIQNLISKYTGDTHEQQ